MTEKIELTDRALRNLKPAPDGKRYEIADTHIGGLRVRVGEDETDKGKAGAISFVLYARFPPSTNPTRRGLGTFPAMSLAEARNKAREWKAEIAKGIDPKAATEAARAATDAAKAVAATKTFDAVADAFIKRHVRNKDRLLRSADEIEKLLRNHARPTLGGKQVGEIRRSDIAKLLDTIEDNAGPRAADKTLAILSKLFVWWQSREDDFVSPVVRGMGRFNAKERARSRILGRDNDRKADDAELQAFWAATGDAGTFGAFCRLLLLTGQRKAKVASLRWQDIDATGLWTIPVETREKTNAGALQLSKLALDIVANVPRRADSEYIFAGRHLGPINNFSKPKLALDKAFAEHYGKAPAPWVLHDLRRTAKSLMARADVLPHVSERVLGHAIAGVEGVYDQHDYAAQKTDALARLAALVAEIIDPRPADNVVHIKVGRG